MPNSRFSYVQLINHSSFGYWVIFCALIILCAQYLEYEPQHSLFQVCKSGHIVNKWCSQPILIRRLHGGDLMLSAAILLSGNNFSKVALFARFLKLQFVSSTVFLRIQRVYLVPCIDSFWEETQDALLAGLRDEPIVVLGELRTFLLLMKS